MLEDMYSKSICFVIPNFVTFSTGGAEIQVHYLTQAFLSKGWKVEVVCAGIGHEKKIQKSSFLNDNIQYHYYRKRNIRILEFFDVLKLLKRTNSKYYYQRTDFAITAATYCFTKKRQRVMAYALASDMDALPNKYSDAFKEFNYSSVIKKGIRKTDFFLLDKMIEWTKKRVDKVICQNEYQLHTYRKNFNVSGQIIPNSFMIEEGIVSVKEKLVLWVGNDNPVKQAPIFVDLAKSLTEYQDWNFVMLGSACDSIDKRNLPNNISMLGSVTYQEANEWFAKAMVYVNTSAYEGMPNTFIQSWYFETLVFSLNVDPNHVFSDLNVGFYFGNNEHKMRQELVKVIEGSNFNAQLNKGRKYFDNHFNMNKNLNELIDYIEN